MSAVRSDNACTLLCVSLLPVPARYRYSVPLGEILSPQCAQTLRAHCCAYRYCPYPLGIVTLYWICFLWHRYILCLSGFTTTTAEKIRKNA